MEIQHGSGLSPWGSRETPDEAPQVSRAMRLTLWVVRYGIPIAFFVAGVAITLISWSAEGLEAGFMFIGAAIAVWLLNFFFRVGVEGQEERDREDEARAFFDEHGRWPDERA